MKRLWRRVAFVPPAMMMTATLLFVVSSFVRALETSVVRDDSSTTRAETSEVIDRVVEIRSAPPAVESAARFDVGVEGDSERRDGTRRRPGASGAAGRANFVF